MTPSMPTEEPRFGGEDFEELPRAEAVTMHGARVEHDRESDYLTITCDTCGEKLKTYMGIENMVLVEGVAKKHQAQAHS